MSVAETELTKPAKVFSPAESRQQEKRNLLPGICVGQLEPRASSDDSTLIEKWEIPLDLKVQAPETVNSEIAVVIVAALHPIESTGSWVQRFVTIVVLGKCGAIFIVWLAVDTRRIRNVETLFDRR